MFLILSFEPFVALYKRVHLQIESNIDYSEEKYAMLVTIACLLFFKTSWFHCKPIELFDELSFAQVKERMDLVKL